jgi:hypothetical protein
MRIKLTALLAFVVLALAGCNAADTGNRAATNTATVTNTSNAATTTVAQNNPNTVTASANSSDTTGGTKEGCKCSAVNMECHSKDGKGNTCCKSDGSCTTMKDGKSKCCTKEGKDGDACCSAAGKTASMTDHSNMNGAKKPETANSKKSD